MNLPDISSVAAIPAERILALLAHLSALQGALTTRLLTDRADSARAVDSAADLLTAGELAKILGVPESKVRSEQRAGRIPCVSIGRYKRFKRADVENALNARQTVRTPARR
jgi:excisionase family DNA binding protein